MKALYISDVGEEELSLLNGLVAADIEVVALPPDMKEEALGRAGEFEIVVGARVDREFLGKAANLKYFVIPFAGIPPQDLEVLPDFPHLTILNSHFNARHVAEHAWALLLASVKRLCPVHEKLRRGDWTPRYEHKWSGAITGGTLLIVGYGSLGRAVARIAKAFEVKVSAVKRTPGNAPEIDFLGTLSDLPTLLPESDFIIVTLPGTEATKNLMGKREFGLVKPGAHIVNVGRGTVIEEDALYDALKEGKVAGAGIDTWWVYPKNKDARSNTFPSNRHLWEFENVVFSPHRASHVRGREKDRMRDLAGILNSIARGAPINVVDLREGY